MTVLEITISAPCLSLQGKMLLKNACILTMNTAQTFINLISQGIKTNEDPRK